VFICIVAAAMSSSAISHDPLVRLAAGRWTGPVLRRLGLPSPRRLQREAGPYRADELRGRTAALAAAPGGRALAAAQHALQGLGATLQQGVAIDPGRGRVDVALFDATGCADVDSLDGVRRFFAPLMRERVADARLLVLATDPRECAAPLQWAAAAALEGFVRTLAKEAGRSGSTANLLYLGRDALDRLHGPLRFFCSHRSAYVSGRALTLADAVRATVDAAPALPRLAHKRAIVTGAARGLGAATVERLAEEGARVLCIDVPAAEPALRALAQRVNGDALALDITAADAPGRLVGWLQAQQAGVDVLVHNAGITRDRTLARMSDAEWHAVMTVNLQAVVALDNALDAAALLHDGAREVCLSSISGIAGNVGQANYAASKAALIGYASARAAQLASRGISVNCVAPGFIETEMTRRIPLTIREAGRRMNALAQGGQPRDVAELVTFLALPEACGISGQTIRVCGQALLGA
jgi:3-oxoacyl-[acyl-carrier protein] reductase